MSPAPALHHAAVRCRDLARVERFYREVLGLEVLRRWPRAEADGGGDRSVWLVLGGGGFLALERADEDGSSPGSGPAAGPRLATTRGVEAGAGSGVAAGAPDAEPFGAAPAGWHVVALSMGMAERDAWAGRLEAAGISIEKRTRFSLFFRDPEGNHLALSHWPEPAGEPGKEGA